MAEHALGEVVRRVRCRITADPHRQATDRQLLERFLHQHDETAFTALVRRHQKCVYSALTKVLHDPADVEDAFQATFLVLVRKATSVRWQEGLGTWLYAVAHRVAVHARGAARTRQRHESQAAERTEPTSAPPDLSCREACAVVHEELERLPDALRLPLLLCYLEGKSRDEAASQLGVSSATVKGRLERGRNVLRERLTRRGVPLTAGLLVALTHSTARASSPALVEATVAAASDPSAHVADLARGVSATMILSKFKLGLGLILLVGLLAALLGSQLPARPAVADKQEKKQAPSAKPADASANVLAGRVLDEAGKPVAGAKLSLWTDKGKSRPAGETGKDGRFRIELGKDDAKAKLIVQAKGQGLDWIDVNKQPGGEVTVRLSGDIAIQGRVLDLEGRPVVGARVRVKELCKSDKGNLDHYLDAWANVNRGAMIPRLPWLPPAAVGTRISTTTDKKGEFRLEGFGRERLVDVIIEGKGIEMQWLQVITRPGLKKVKYRSFHGPTFEVLVGPGKVLVGTVKVKGTGEPAAGVEVSCQRGQTRTDAQGRFRIEGLRKEDRSLGWVSGPGYFDMMLEVKDTPGLDDMRADIEIQRGIYLHGVLRDRATGKPVSGLVNYHIKSDNPHLKNYVFSTSTSMGRGSAGADGKFRILVIPGPAYLAVQADQNLYTRATPPNWNGHPIGTVPHALFPYHYHAIFAIDPDEKKADSLKCDIELDPGLKKTGTITGPDGKPVTNVIAFGLTAIPDPGARTFPRSSRFGPLPPERLKTSEFTAVGLNPKEPRHLVFLQPEKKLGKIIKVKGDEKEPLSVKLEPLGAITGRVLTEDGKPAEERIVIPGSANLFAFYRDYPIELLQNMRSDRRMGRLIRWLPEGVKTDAEGKFRMDGLIPGLPYRVTVTTQAVGMRGIPSHAHEDIIVEAGKTKDLGDLKRWGR
jgi:RNA polymerase sigma factor (sigma-70 family)